jgi:hypothetical protein
MSKTLRTSALIAVLLAGATVADAQPTIDAGREANPIWRGLQAGSRAGTALDHGSVVGDGHKDLIIGTPGGAGIAGAVYVLRGGPVWTGTLPLSSASVIISGAAAGDLFGFAVANGNVLNREGSDPKTLIVGAPGAMSNRGIVYVFETGYTDGDQIAASQAVARIIGKPGERLGTSLATADLNNDGFREIIIGAPGTGTATAPSGAVYAIAGGPSLTGTIDLTITAPAWSFAYPGLGLTLAAGDVTGDRIYDVLVGHPAENAVHLLRGRNGAMPPSTLDMTFLGVNTGDNVGVSIKISDVDDDKISDLVIGAPDADGPSNSRANAGEAYLIWGGVTLSGRSLAMADVTFYGAAAGARMGALIAAGDVNRDTPDDLVFGSPGAHGGAGKLDILYGGERSSIGIATGSGARLVDFASHTPDRVILGDTAGGTISASQVYEVTGEGARDVIVGMNGVNSNTGAVYFTISPRIKLASHAVSLNGPQDSLTSATVGVTNISQIPITWSISSDQQWLTTSTNGSASAGAPGQIVVTGNGQGLAPGTYSARLTVTSTSPDLMMFQTITVTFTVREIRPTPAAPPTAGTPPGAIWKLFWRHATENWLAFWHMNGATYTGAASLSVRQMADTTWRIAAIADLNGDGHRDVVWQQADGWLAVWFLRDAQVISGGFLSVNRMTDPTWKIRAAGDTNADGMADLIWQNDDGHLGVWFMNGDRVTRTAMLSVAQVTPTTWQIQAAGDTNGDGRADLLWRNSATGDLGVWFLDGSRVTGTANLSVGTMPDTNWKIVGSEDVNGDRKADVLWQHTDGTLATWYLNGRNVIGTLLLNPSRAASVDWRVAGPK